MLMDWDPIIRPCFTFSRTCRFSVLSFDEKCKFLIKKEIKVHAKFDSSYTQIVIAQALKRSPWCKLTDSSSCQNGLILGDFEFIEWDLVLSGKVRASSYFTRKGLSRKAQFALQVKRYTKKVPNSVLSLSVPFTIILETWNATDEMKIDFGLGVITGFDDLLLQRTPILQRLRMSLEYEEEVFSQQSNNNNILWILKPSVTNKGMGISIHRDWMSVLGALEEDIDIKEWVLQK